MQRQCSKRRRRAVPRVRRSIGRTDTAEGHGAAADGRTDGIGASLKRVEKPVSKVAWRECRRSSKRGERAESEWEEMSCILELREEEYRRLRFHHKNLVMVLREAERRKGDLASINENLETRNARLSEDIALLKNVVYRINSELERCREEHRWKANKADGQIFAEERVNVGASRAWAGVDLHALAPLLNAYDERLAETQDLVERYREEFALFGNKCKKIIEENGDLRREVRDLELQCGGQAKETKALRDDIALVKKRNVDLSIRASVQRKRLEEACASYKERLETISRENGDLRNERLVDKMELNDLKRKYEDLAKQYGNVLNENAKSERGTDHAKIFRLEECGTLKEEEELRGRREIEKKEPFARIRDMENGRTPEEQRLVDVTEERDRLKRLAKRLRKDLRHARRRADYSREMANSIGASCDLFKRQWRKTSLRCKELLGELERVIVEKEELAKLVQKTGEENAAIFYLGDSIAKRMSELKNELQTVQTDAKTRIAMVERHTKMHDLRVRRMKKEYFRKLQRLKRVIELKERIIGKLKKEKSMIPTNLDVARKPVSVEIGTIVNETL